MPAQSIRTILAAVLVFALLPLTVHADNGDRRFYLSPGLNYLYPDKDSGLDAALGFQLGIGKALSNHFNLELHTSHWEDEDGAVSGELNTYGLNLLYLFQRDDLSPFLLLGVSATDFDITTNGVVSDESGVAADLGLGLLQQIAKHGTALRWEYKYRFNQAENEDFGDNLLSLALQIPLGAAPVPAPPPPPPPPPVKPVAKAKPVPPPAPQPVLPKPAIVLQGVHFEFDSAKLTVEAQKILSNSAIVLKEMPELRTIAIGHTCSIGTDSYNDQLSLGRAISVRDFLVSRGVNSDRVRVRGYGETRPVADNATEEGRVLNRRVEISVINESLCLPPREGEATDANGCAIFE